VRAAERLQPSLFDRLTDPAPTGGAINASRLRELVVRDLAWLLNTTHLAADLPLSGWPEVERSVLNFGVPDLAGRTLGDRDGPRLEKAIQKAITDFEPRILERTLRVRLRAASEEMSVRSLFLEIEGEVWGEPVPLHLYLKTELDLETGTVVLGQAGAAGPR